MGKLHKLAEHVAIAVTKCDIATRISFLDGALSVEFSGRVRTVSYGNSLGFLDVYSAILTKFVTCLCMLLGAMCNILGVDTSHIGRIRISLVRL